MYFIKAKNATNGEINFIQDFKKQYRFCLDNNCLDNHSIWLLFWHKYHNSKFLSDAWNCGILEEISASYVLMTWED